MNDYRQKFQNLLRSLFQFDSADLDFGIYRIMNYKRDVIEKFIEKDLLDAVSKELESGALAEQSAAAREIEEVKKQIEETLGEAVLDGDGNLAEEYHKTPLGKRYLQLKETASGTKPRPALEAMIFNHLFTFFSRYYDAGDFMSKRRYSKKEKYAIPYNGEEVYLHWANKDQYYIKTGEYFTDYRFKSGDVTVHFKLQIADLEKDNVKGDKRFFIPLYKEASFDPDRREIVIPFHYRPLTDKEDISYGKRNQQEAIISEALDKIPKGFSKELEALAALSAEKRNTSDGKNVSFLEHHLRQYTRRNTSDFFIHKDLEGFLTKELDFYLKNEVLNLDELEAGGEIRSESWFQIMRAMKEIGNKIIAFISQIENFQKKLWEKKKFILETNYCITVGNIPEEFYEEIAENEAQWEEWKELFRIDEEERNLFTPKSKKKRRIEFLKGHPTLVLDTRYFDLDFKDRLLAIFENLDEISDGLLVHSENFQALKLLLEKYRDKVKCIYIDPPYNTGNDEFIYKDNYQHSSWCAMMEQGLRLAREWMKKDGTIFVSVDDNEQSSLKYVMDLVFNSINFIAKIVRVSSPTQNVTKFISVMHDYVYVYTYDRNICQGDWQVYKNNYDEFERRAANLLKRGLSQQEIEQELRELVKYPRFYEFDHYYNCDERGVCQNVSMGGVQKGNLNSNILHPISKRPCAKPEGGWRYKDEEIKRLVSDGLIYFGIDENTIPRRKLYLKDYLKQLPRGIQFFDTQADVKGIKSMGLMFDFPKPSKFVEQFISMTEADITLDFFAGSGTTANAVINLNRVNGVRKKYILIEIAEMIYTIIIPRIKKSCYSKDWTGGKPVSQDNGIEHIFKYIRMESYEDALNNITLKKPKDQMPLEFDDYFLSYMLEWETRESETFLNVEKLASPFNYKLLLTEGQETRHKKVDLPETFTYLLGLHVKTRRIYNDKGRRYLVYRGTVDQKEMAVIWRETEGWGKDDFERDKKFVLENKLIEGADEVFVNSDSVIPGARSLDPIFKRRMFGEA